jgi:hypothetical protein
MFCREFAETPILGTATVGVDSSTTTLTAHRSARGGAERVRDGERFGPLGQVSIRGGDVRTAAAVGGEPAYRTSSASHG